MSYLSQLLGVNASALGAGLGGVIGSPTNPARYSAMGPMGLLGSINGIGSYSGMSPQGPLGLQNHYRSDESEWEFYELQREALAKYGELTNALATLTVPVAPVAPRKPKSLAELEEEWIMAASNQTFEEYLDVYARD